MQWRQPSCDIQPRHLPRQHFGSTRTRKYDKGIGTANRDGPAPVLQTPVGTGTASITPILDRLAETIRPEVLVQAARRELILAQAEKDKQTRWKVSDEVLQIVADLARQAWADAILQAKDRMQPSWMAWVASPVEAGAFAGALDTLSTEAPDDFLTAVCAEVLQSEEVQSMIAEQVRASSEAGAAAVVVHPGDTVRKHVQEHQKKVLDDARERAVRVASESAQEQALQRSRKLAEERALDTAQAAASAAAQDRTQQWVTRTVQAEVEKRTEETSRSVAQAAAEAASRQVQRTVESAADRCLQDIERTHARFEQMVAKQELHELEERLQILKLERRLDDLRRDSPSTSSATAWATGSRVALDADGRPHIL